MLDGFVSPRMMAMWGQDLQGIKVEVKRYLR